MKKINLEGVVTAIATPFNQDETIDFETLREYAKYVSGLEGINGMLTCGYSGEITSLSREEQLEIVRAVRSVVPEDFPIITSLLPTSTKDSIEFGLQLKEAGADVLQVNTPFYNILRRGYLNNDEVILQFFDDIAEGIGLPFTIFQYPKGSGVTYHPETIGKLSERDYVVGIKEATTMETYEADYKAVAGRTAVFADNNTYTLIGMMLYGTEGSMVGIGNVGVPLWAELYKLIDSKQITEAIELANTRIVPLINTFSRDLGQTQFSFVSRIKEALYQMGHFKTNVSRAPEPQVTEEEKKEITEALQQAGLL